MRNIKQKFRQKTATPKGKIIVASFFLVLFLGIAGGLFYWQTHKKKIIREELESAIRNKSGGFYNIKYETLDLDEVTGYLSITNLSLEYDSLKFGAMQELDLIPPTLLKIHIPEITVDGVKTPRALIDKEIAGRKLELRNPTIEIIYTMQGKDSARNVPTKQVYEEILGNLNLISLDTVLITGATITTRNLKTKEQGIAVSNMSVQLTDVKVDSAANADPTRLLFSKGITVSCEKFGWSSKNKLYNYGVSNLSVNSTDRIVHIDNFSIDPQRGEDAFVRSLPAQDDRFDFSFKDITINDVGIPQLMEEEFAAETMTIGSASFKIYRDLNIPRDKKNRVGTYPHQVLDDIPIPVSLKKIIVGNAFLEYKERSSITKKAGKVQFYNVAATITNLTNKKDLVAKNNIMTAEMSTSFLNKTPLKASWLFYLGNSKGKFKVKGTMGSITAEDLNALTEPMGPARLEKGVIKSLWFDLDGSDYSTGGSVRMIYDDLKISVLEKDKDSKELDRKSLTSFVANILIKNSNPKNKDDEPRTVTVVNERDTNRSIFNVVWKTLFKGIRQTVGIKK